MKAEDLGPRGEVPAVHAASGVALAQARAQAVVCAPTRAGWRAELSLGFQPRYGRTRITEQAHLGPLRIQRPFYPEPNGTCHVYVLHPPGGVVGGDVLDVTLRGAEGARALLTTPGATKLYRSPGARAEIRQQFEFGEHSCLEWFPQETIAFEGTHASVKTHVRLAATASYAGWEIVCLGRPAAGERFRAGSLRLEHSIERAGRLQWIERAEYGGGDAMLEAAWGMAGHAVIGTFVIAPGSPPEPEWVEQLRASLLPSQGEEPHGVAGHFALTLVSSAIVLRYLGDHAHQASTFFRRAWQLIRPRYAAAAVAPRIWHT
ncbi:MAG: urease accessory protein UreD [Myxococcales bacterium]